MSNQAASERFIDKHSEIFISDWSNPIHSIEYRPEFYQDELYAQFEVDKPPQNSQWIPTRKAQFLAGRIAAKKALSSFKLPTSEHQVGIGDSREPIWPEGSLGSISHAGKASITCIKKQPKNPAGLGIDIQETIACDLRKQISSTVLSHKETLLFKQGFRGISEPEIFTLLFSAKESFFKAAFNSVGEYFDFTDVSIVALDVTKQQITLRTNKRLSDDLPEAFENKISYIVLKTPTPRVITACYWEL